MVTNDVSSTTKKFNPPPLVSIIPEDDSDLNDKEKKMKLLVRAQKYLPFGYGPGKTVILEAAEIDDDEEDYGDYQVTHIICWATNRHDLISVTEV
jgi:hypothetical protein